MPSKKVEELRGMTNEELMERLKEVEKEFFLMEAKRLMGAAEKIHLNKALRREKARILTILRERGIKL
ncbi:MAG TPA: 50S ribosomal protein L29 [Candidatus Korarchaeota archaeon]|nr:50S ribosomal protein L29 [Candidatus Korarchaeota archaeon]